MVCNYLVLPNFKIRHISITSSPTKAMLETDPGIRLESEADWLEGMPRMKRGCPMIFAALILLGSSEWCAAHGAQAEPLVTDRPDFTESAETVAPGLFQLESGYTFTRRGDDKEHALGEFLGYVNSSVEFVEGDAPPRSRQGAGSRRP